jgi:hypothetical protein
MSEDGRTPGAIEAELSRRGFLVGAAGGALGLAGLTGLLRAFPLAHEALAQTLGGGAGLSPDDPAVRATMAAFADTIVPGPGGGADSHPGALEAGALDEAYDSFYGLRDTFPLIHQDLVVSTPRVLGRLAQFDLNLPYPDRERVVLDRITGTGGGQGGNLTALAFAAPAVVIYIAYYGTARSRLGPQYLGFPTSSRGYWPGHSYKLRFKGMTRDGNPR